MCDRARKHQPWAQGCKLNLTGLLRWLCVHGNAQTELPASTSTRQQRSDGGPRPIRTLQRWQARARFFLCSLSLWLLRLSCFPARNIQREAGRGIFSDSETCGREYICPTLNSFIVGCGAISVNVRDILRTNKCVKSHFILCLYKSCLSLYTNCFEKETV